MTLGNADSGSTDNSGRRVDRRWRHAAAALQPRPAADRGPSVVQSTGSVAAVGATITIGANSAVSPSQVTIAIGQSVTFVNNDSRSHDMESDPHPAAYGLSSIANVGLLQPGQSKTTFGFANSGSCGYHDHNNSDNTSLQGRIVVQ